MAPSYLQDLLESTLSSAKASVSVILVLIYGFYTRKWNVISQEGESNMSKLGTTLFLPCLLFSEIGPLATASNLRNYWPIIPLSLFFQLVSLAVGMSANLIFKMPHHYVPMFIFNNVTSLPLLLLQALSKTGSLDSLLTPGESLNQGLKKGRVYLLINALVGNLCRFALGPYLMKAHQDFTWSHPFHEDPNTPPRKDGEVRLLEYDPQSEDDNAPPPSRKDKALSAFSKAKSVFLKISNPPLIGGTLAVFFGIIPFFHKQLFNNTGVLTPLADSIENVGGLFTALQMFVLGAHLYSKKGSHASIPILIFLFAWRFFAAPALSIGVIYLIRTRLPNWIDNDPMLDFVLMISNTGPPALTLSAIADMADLTADVEGQVSRILLLSYAVTPLISLPVTAALTVVGWSRK